LKINNQWKVVSGKLKGKDGGTRETERVFVILSEVEESLASKLAPDN